MTSGADFVKTSTGKIDLGATLAGSLCMMEAARDFHAETGRHVGIKVAGGVRTAEAATRYVALAQETLGVGWTSPERFRIGASSLLTDVIARLHEERSGR
jgi:deoxyribose-phosphate aldolase